MITHRTRNEADLRPLEVRIPCAAVTLEGTLAFPPEAKGVVVFAHDSGSSRYSPRNQFVARVLRESGNGTLLFDELVALMTPKLFYGVGQWYEDFSQTNDAEVTELLERARSRSVA